MRYWKAKRTLHVGYDVRVHRFNCNSCQFLWQHVYWRGPKLIKVIHRPFIWPGTFENLSDIHSNIWSMKLWAAEDRIIIKVAKEYTQFHEEKRERDVRRQKFNWIQNLAYDAFACFFLVLKMSFKQSKERGSKFPSVLCKINGFYFHSFVFDFKFANGNGMCARDKEQAKTFLRSFVRLFICFCTSSISFARAL